MATDVGTSVKLVVAFSAGVIVGILGFVFLPLFDYALQWVLVVIDARMK